MLGQKLWLPGNSLGLLLHKHKYELFELWKPELWNNFCIIGDYLEKQYKAYLNNKLIYQSETYDGVHRKGTGNLFLLNGYSYRYEKFVYPFQGEVTDVNIWNKTLSQKDMDKWSNCQSGEPGNIVNWNEARFKFYNIETTDIHMDEICIFKDPEKFITFNQKINFNETKKFCQKMGGQVAVAENFEKLEKMVDAFRLIDFEIMDQQYFYSGYWNSNGWKNANNGENLEWNNWSDEEINRYYNSCATIETKSLKFRGNKCQVELYPICYFKDGLTELQLRGMDIEDTKDIESQFYLVNSTHMMGKTRSSIVYQNNVWHIKSGRKNVFTTSGKTVPLGVKEWNGTKGKVRMILHKKVEQPGNFCCDDALCIPSTLVCDTVQNCEDNSDEKNCSKIIFDRNYDKNTPPRPDSFIVNVKDHHHYLKIETRIEIIELISVSQNLGEMSLFLKLTLNWYDSKLNSFFLDDDYNNNDINNNVENKLWTPTIDYMYLKKRRKVFRQLSIQKLSEPKMFGEIHIHQPSELYEGSENSIRLEIYHRVDILCMFNQIKDYPFGDDSCYINIYLDGNDNKWATFDPVILSMRLCTVNFFQFS